MSGSESCSYRALRDGDVELVCMHRERMFIEAGHDARGEMAKRQLACAKPVPA